MRTQLASVSVGETGSYDNGMGELVVTPGEWRSGGSGSYEYDALGRQVRQLDRNRRGDVVGGTAHRDVGWLRLALRLPLKNL